MTLSDDMKVLMYYQVKKFKEGDDIHLGLVVPDGYLKRLFNEREDVKQYLTDNGVVFTDNMADSNYQGWDLTNREDVPDYLKGFTPQDKHRTTTITTTARNYKIMMHKQT